MLIQIMGTPSRLNKMPLGGETWWYGGTAYVNFNEEGLVEGWTDIRGDTLKVKYNEPPVDATEDVSEVENNPAGAFTQGSSKDHVNKIMGTPSRLNKMPLGGETWWYGGTAYVNFNEEGLVEGWTDIRGDTLKVK